MSSGNQEAQMEEQLITSVGYLKIPTAVKQAVKHKFGPPRTYPNPSWKVTKDDEDTLEIKYVFQKKKFDEAKL